MSIATAVPSIQILLSLQPEELAFHILQVLGLRPQFQMEALRTHSGAGIATTWSWGYGQQNDVAAEQAITEAWRWLEFNLFILPAANGSGFFVLGRRAKSIVDRDSFDHYRRAAAFPRELLHPSLADAVWPTLLRGDLDTAVFTAFLRVEVAVRAAAGLANSDLGVALMRKAFDAESGPLRNRTDEKAEREALAHLFAGAIGSYKNPRSHRTVGLVDFSEAQEMVMLASHLLRIVESRRPGVQPVPATP